MLFWIIFGLLAALFVLRALVRRNSGPDWPAIILAGAAGGLLILRIVVHWHWFFFRRLPGWLEGGLVLLLLVAFVAYLITRPLGRAFLLVTLVLGLLLGPIHIGGGKGTATAAPTPTSTTSTTVAPTTTTSTTVPASACTGGHNVVLDTNQGNRVLSKGIDTSHPRQAVEQIMKYAGHDPRILQLYWDSSPLGKQSPIKDWHTLVKGGCYTQAAQNMLLEMTGLYTGSAVSTSNAPPVGTNTGVTPKGNPFTITETITGNRIGIMITFPNGSKIWVMHRCGNVVVQSPSVPGVPARQKPPVPMPAQLKNCRLKDKNPDTDKDGLCASNYLTTSPSVNHRSDPGRSPGSKVGRGSGTHEDQIPPIDGQPPDSGIGSRLPASGTPSGSGNASDPAGGSTGFNQPPSTTPDQGTLPPGSDPCAGVPFGTPGSLCP